uniref:Gustatory receptor n=1 Tax=Timema poppense TaxID=170557 RepID=A0A7R9CN99_TIMPO|nr:unnamed protein product [Timema poppensis]
MKEVPQELFTRRLHKGESEKNQKSKETLYEALKPLFYMCKIFGLFPLSRPTPGENLLRYISLNMIYPIMFYITTSTFIVYKCTTHVSHMLTGRISFERIFEMVTGKPLVFIKLKHNSYIMISSYTVVAMLISLSQYILRSRNDLIDEIDFEILLIYWYTLVIINLHSGMWSLLCEASVTSSTTLRRHFQEEEHGNYYSKKKQKTEYLSGIRTQTFWPFTGKPDQKRLTLFSPSSWKKRNFIPDCRLPEGMVVSKCHLSADGRSSVLHRDAEYIILSHFILLVCSVFGLLSAALQGKFGGIGLSIFVNIVWSCLVLYNMCNNAHRATVENLLNIAPRIIFRCPLNPHNILVQPKLPDPATNNNKQFQAKGSYPCDKQRCSTCKIHQPSTSFNSRPTQMEYSMKGRYE